jgi:NAD(P)-dependent dehydrogenase (short-subunit alcohol dehydrogenase family)
MTRRIAILGGAGGIGRALVSSLLAGGDDVVVLDLPASLERHRPDTNSIAIDVLSETAIGMSMTHLAKHWDAVDGFVNLAGYNSKLQPLAETSADYFDDIIAGNLRGAFLSTRAVLPLMAEGSSLVMVSSGLASFVRVNTVAPGLVDTAFLRGGTGRSDESGDSVVNFAPYLQAIPLKRLAVPDDVVGPIRFLLGPDSSYMTGQVLWINGGAYMP